MPFRYRDELEGRSFALPTVPYPGEGLSGLLLRACHENGFTKVSQISNLWGGHVQGIGVSPWTMTSSSIDISLVGRVLGCTEEAVEALSMKQAGPLVSFFGNTIRRRNLVRVRRVSPSTLRIAPYQKAIWELMPLGFDPLTLERLIDKCPVCRRDLGWKTTLGICHCEHCVDPANPFVSLTDLRDFPQETIEVNDKIALRSVVSLIDPEVSSSDLGWLHGDFHRLNRGEIFELAVEMARLIDQEDQPPDETRPHWLGELSPVSLSVAGRALLDWPHGFFEVGERLRHNWFFRRKPGGPLWHPLRQVLQTKVFGAEITRLVADALKGALATSVSRSRPRIGREVAGNSPDLVRIVKMSELIVSEASKTALPIPVLLDCYQSDYFLCPDPYFAELRKKGRHLDDVFSAIPFALISESMHRLRDVVYVYFRKAGNPWPIVLNALAEGRVPAVRSEGGGSTIDDIYVVDLEPWRMFLTELRPIKRRKSVRLTVAEAAFFLNTGQRAVAKLMRLGFLDRTLTLAALQTLSRKYIFSKEVCLRSAFAGTQLNFKYEGGALKEAGILPVGPGLHLRERRAVERYYNERTLPSVEASSDSQKVRRLCSRSKKAGINLTPREAQIALSAGGRWRRREIAAQLGIGINVYTYALKKIYRKCGVASRTELGERIEILMKPASTVVECANS